MKKLLALLLVGMMIFSLAACGDNSTTDPDKDNPGTSQSGENNDSQGGEENQGGENNDGGQDYENAGFNKAQRKVIAEQIGVTTEGEKVVFMYVPEEGDEVVYYDVYDQFNGTSCRYTEYRFCKNKDAYDEETYDIDGEYDDLTANENDLYFYGSEEASFSWAGSYQAIVDYHNEHTAPYNDEYVLVE